MEKIKKSFKIGQTIKRIIELEEYLEKEEFNFYDGGHSFDECYSLEIEEYNSLLIALKKKFESIKT